MRSHIRKREPVKYKAQILTKEQIKALFDALKGSELEIPIHLAIALGLRRGELLALKWDDVDFKAKTIHIRRNIVPVGKELIIKTPKSKSSIRTLKLPDFIVKLLAKHKARQAELKLMLGNIYRDKKGLH